MMLVVYVLLLLLDLGCKNEFRFDFLQYLKSSGQSLRKN